ncbi:hypothetical protein O6H91_20G063400 [Diphasiastrum complanatum]|uniref:Uncharacterized protein n=1 Tax=Diphasiastrum complanatum TaxID=34168 RepID=A0ACC2AR48_DIPCM|nr:hypothetical protein O6H91_20G063400 [Diphasiastrum complanatum]
MNLLPELMVKVFSYLRAVTSPSLYLKGEVGDGREKALLEYVLQHAAECNPESVLQAIDKYAQRTWLMNVGAEKGQILDTTILNRKPRVVLELGAYCGYSAIRIASQLQDPESTLISLEMNPQNAAIARTMIDFAGLSSKVQVIEGILSTRMEELRTILQEMNARYFDVVFIDHDKGAYLSDMLLLKESSLIGQGTVLVADNMGIPGSPAYSKYLKSHPLELETVEHKCGLEYLSWLPDIVTVSTYLACE